VAFVLKMMEESLLMRQRCRWFTSLLGKLSSVGTIVERLRKENIDNYAIKEIVQGQTRRWVVAWSFMDLRLPDSIAHATSPSLRNFLPLHTTIRHSFRNVYSPGNLADALHTVLGGIEAVSYTMETEGIRSGFADNDNKDRICATYVTYGVNTWSRAVRRRKKYTTTADEVPTETHLPASSMSISWPSPMKGNEVRAPLIVTAQWNRGFHRGDFEGLWSHICRKLEERFER